MKQKMKSSKGITLIALVITIIVLLILAAVSIATLTGENGILTKASKAKQNTETEEEKEQIRLAYTAALANNKDNFEVAATDLGDELAKLTSEATVSGSEAGFTIIFTKNNYTHTYTLDSKGQITGPEEVAKEPNQPVKPEENWEKLADQITAKNYGDLVAYDIDLDGNEGTNDWKIFYKDEDNNVFLIAADHLDYTINASKLKLTEAKMKHVYDNGKYSLNWNKDNLPTVDSQKEGIKNTLFKSEMYDITTSDHSNNIPAKCVSALLNTNNWTGFVNSSYSDYAIGSPTLEMWTKSWNEKGNSYGNNEYITLSTSIVDDMGYNLNNNVQVILQEYGDSNNQTGYYDELYFPHQNGVNSDDSFNENETHFETSSYWLASPASYKRDGSNYTDLYAVHYPTRVVGSECNR